MARPSASPSAPKKEPGRLRQMVDVFKMTRRMDPSSLWYMILAFILPVLAGVALAVFLSPDNIIGLILYIVAGVLGGVLLFLIVLGRKAERAAYTQHRRAAGRGRRGAQERIAARLDRQRDAGQREPEDPGCGVPRGRSWRDRADRRRPAQPHAADAGG